MTIERVNSTTAKRIITIIQRIERVQEERDELAIDISEIYREAKGAGFNVKALKALISERKKRQKNPTAFDADEADLDLYRAVLLGTNIEDEEVKASEPPAPAIRDVEVPEGSVSTDGF